MNTDTHKHNKLRKELVIIRGVTGAVGSAILERYGRRKQAVIYGISREARPWQDFIDKQSSRLFVATVICSVDATEEACQSFVEAIDLEQFRRVTYIHGVGSYRFEIDASGSFVVENDQDSDGVNDECLLLSYHLFRWMMQPLIDKFSGRIDGVIFGGLADKHLPRILHSWCSAMKRTEGYMREKAGERVRMFWFDISSVLCPHELLTRPFVFSHTDADPRSWLSPSELAKTVLGVLRNKRTQGSLLVTEVFRPWTNYFEEYYSDEYMVPRRLAETRGPGYR